MIRKNGTSPWRFVAAALVPLVGASTALAGNFKLNVGTYKVSIAYDGSTADVRKLLGTIPTYTDVNSGATKWAPATAASDTTLKSAALAMGLGHTLFLLLSDIEADLKATTLSDATLDKTAIAANVVEAMGINQWFSTALQETRLVYAEHSGYFQNDNAPDVIYSNASNSATARKASKYKFLQNLKGGAACDLTTAAGKGAVLNYMNLQGFVWAAVEKGYFEALSYNINKTGCGDVPSKGFSLPQWAMNYASKADAVVDAATAQVNELSWDQPYSSDTTSDNMRKVAQAILDASN